MKVTYEARLDRVADIAPQTRSLFLRMPPGARFGFVPGQFISCLLPIGGQTLIRPYSIASDPEEAEVLEICLNLVPNGVGSSYLFGLRVGDTLRFTGPWGTFTLERSPQAECVFIAEGTGIAPIRPMLRRVLANDSGHGVRLHYAVASAPYLLYGNEFEAAAAACPRFSFEPLIGGSLLEVIEQRYITRDADRSRHFYICAVGDIVPRLRDVLRGAGYERRAVQYEKW